MDIEDAASELESIRRRSQKELDEDDLFAYGASVYAYTDEVNRIVDLLRNSLPGSFHDISALVYPNLHPSGRTASPEYGKVLLRQSMVKINLVSETLCNRLARMLPAPIHASKSEGKPKDALDITQLHPRIVETSGSLFRDGHYSQAILDAFKAVNNYVKGKSRLQLDGQELMAQAFKDDDPVIRLNEGRSQSEKDERKGFRFLYMGAMCGIRNPKAHELVQLGEPDRALEYLALASLLMRRAEEGKVTRRRRRANATRQN